MTALKSTGYSPDALRVFKLEKAAAMGTCLCCADARPREGPGSQIVVDFLRDLTHQGRLAEPGVGVRALRPEKTDVYAAANGAADKFPPELVGLLIEGGLTIRTVLGVDGLRGKRVRRPDSTLLPCGRVRQLPCCSPFCEA